MKAITALRLVRMETPVRAGDVRHNVKEVTEVRLHGKDRDGMVRAVTSIIR